VDDEVGPGGVEEEIRGVVEGSPLEEGVVEKLVEYAYIPSVARECVVFEVGGVAEDGGVGQYAYDEGCFDCMFANEEGEFFSEGLHSPFF